MDNIVEIFFKASIKFPDHQAIIHKSESISYAQLSQEVKYTAAYLKKKGIKRGSRVLVFIPMSIKLYQTVLALFSIGAVVVFVDEWSNMDRLKKAMKVVHVDALIAPKRFLWLAYLINAFKRIKRKITIPTHLESEEVEVESVEAHESALITFTTGSTGIPKAADRTHSFLSEQFRILKEEIGANPGDQCLITLPIVLLSILGTGATGIVADFNQKKADLIDGEKQRTLIRNKLVSIIVASPYYLDKISIDGFNPSQVRKVITGGAPVFPDLAKKIFCCFDKADCLVAYGSTEAEPISTIKMEEVEVNSDGLCVGQIHKEIDCKIIQIRDKPISLENQSWQDLTAEFGEILVSGAHVLQSYYNSEEAFARNKIVDGQKIWHRTGDSGRIVGEQLFLSGRIDQLQIRNGEYQSLFLAEYKLLKVPGVKIGTLINEKLCLELADGAKEVDVEKAVSALGLIYDELQFFPKIPRDKRHHSKIDYKSLLKLMDS